MDEKRFTIESERIGSTYSIYIFKGDKVIFEISNWGSLSNMHKKECEEFVDYLNSITDEKEELKKELKKYTDAFDCSQCRFQNYDWFDDGDEFEVCEKGNNEAQMENHSCSEWEEI